ncbi:GGDEF domain-containing protein [Dehalobacter sp. 12DCB1]|uniref:GGDEF domain-containing protein n=2 Tax=unclassified Dehalobacter TaxID=2635733 RepID=UPI0018F3D4B1|nr:GGDEF domain-containing protein [Dehalobacter sp. 12DCB1]
MGLVKETNLKQGFYLVLLKAMILLSAFSIIGNLAVGYSLSLNIKWIFLIVLAVCSILYERHKGFSDRSKFLFFLVLTGIVLPLSFIDAGGSNSFTIAYVFFLLIIVSYILDGWYRNTIIAVIILAFMGVHTYSRYFPERIPVLDSDSFFVDQLIQVPIVLLLSFLVVRYFADAYYQTNRRLMQLAHFDELTGLLNRRNFNEILQKQFESGNHNGHLIMLDVDNFKMINDKEGHLAGDDGLKHLGAILRQYFDNGKNMISRWGGDEFIIIYFGESGHVETVLEQVKKEFKEYVKNIEPMVDITFGIAPLQGCQTPNDVLAKADQVMYEKKREKKNS